jgi:hypothetical protein
LGGAAGVAVSIAGGLGARKLLTGLLAKVLGDAFYASMVYGFVLVARPRLSPARAMVASTLLCFAVEFAQLSVWPARLSAWFPPLRYLLGTTFNAWDLCMYLGGTLAAALVHALVRSRC